MADPSEEDLPTDHPDDRGNEHSASDAPQKRARPTGSRGASNKRRRNLPRTEAELNRPEWQTLWMLGTVCVATVIMWGAARAACNYHPPHESRRARPVTLAELTVDPKNAAIEALQRWATHDYAGALAVATGPAAEQIETEQSACSARGASCKQESIALKAKVQTTAELLEVGPKRALVRVFTHGSTPPRSLVEVVRVGVGWKINQRKPDSGSDISSVFSPDPDAAGAAGAAGAPQ